MKKTDYIKVLFIYLIFFVQSSVALSQTTGDIITLKGYFIVSSFDTTFKSGCDLNIKNTTSITGDSMICGDGNFYKNISVIKYVKPKNLDLKQIDKFSYQIKLQKNEHYIYLSIDPFILSEADKGDSSIIKNVDLLNAVKQNQITADQIQKEIERLKIDFKKKKHCDILMEISVKVLVLPKRKKPITFNDPCGLDQYLILFDKKNKIKALKVIDDSF
ncbi:hypothetical protein WAF17_12075 [Bernardetia sp. ABR2-2B]|uniref:hypothetical protein n=1 Tax=Bernardetia sp. ABR2-2B TaxID=3127472 RepID=UPI0030CC3F6E